MEILYLTSRFPFPPIGGDKLRFFNILKYLSKNHKISIVCFSDEKIKPDLILPYRNYFTEIDVVFLPRIRSYINCILGLLKGQPLQISYYKSKRMMELIITKTKQKKIDLIIVHLIRMADYVKDLPIYKVLDMTDAQSLNYIRAIAYTTGKWSIIHRFEKNLVCHYEQQIWRYFNRTFVVSPVDHAYLKSFNRNLNVEVLPNGVDIEMYPFRLNDHDNAQMCFLGNMRTFPNTDAAVWFANEIFPLIQKEIPQAKFYVVGAEPSRRVRALKRIKNVIVTGMVDTIKEYIWNSVVSVAPIRVGAGIQNKILESMALGTPVVTTSVGLEGIEAVKDDEILIADTPNEFASAVIKLVKDKNLRAQISKNGRRLVEKKYTWAKVLKKLDLII